MKLFKDRQRKRLKLDLLLLEPSSFKGKIFKSENLSEGGVFVESPTPLSVGEKVRMKIPINSPFDSIEVGGRVVWNQTLEQKPSIGNKTLGMGICFEDLNEQEKGTLREILDLTPHYGWFT